MYTIIIFFLNIWCWRNKNTSFWYWIFDNIMFSLQ